MASQGHGINRDGTLRSAGRNLGCNSTLWGDVKLTCHRMPEHEGSHLDTDNDVWYSLNRKGVMVFLPRVDGRTVVTPRGRTTTTRKGT